MFCKVVVGVFETWTKSLADLGIAFASLLLKVKLFVVLSLCLLGRDVLPEEITHSSSLFDKANNYRRVFSYDSVSNNNNNNFNGENNRNVYFYHPQSAWSFPKDRQPRNIDIMPNDDNGNGGRDQVSFVNAPGGGHSLHTTITTTDSGVVNPCSDEAMQQCFEKLPSLPGPGIPSSLKEILTMCHAFEMGMSCMKEFSRNCLNPKGQKKMIDSVQGAKEALAFLCGDPKFQKEFLEHKDCYPKVSPLWDQCASDFMSNIKKADNYPSDSRKTCCVRIRFLQCVTELAHLHCGKKAADFLQRIAENIVRETMKESNKDNSGSKKSEGLQCAAFTFKNCTGDKRNAAVWFVGPSYSNPNNAITLLVSLMSIFFTSYLLCML